jgi:leucine dehydrogenase
MKDYFLNFCFLDVDAIVLCGVGGVLNPNTIPHIKAKIICGAANNQLGGELMNY